MTPAEAAAENKAVFAVLAVAARLDAQAADLGVGEDAGVDGEALAVASERGIELSSLPAYASLAASRGLSLEQVVRARWRDELREVVARPAVSRA